MVISNIIKGYGMDSIKFLYDNALVPADQLSKSLQALEPLIKNVSSLGISTVVSDTVSIAKVKELVERKQKHNPAMMIVVGIGGSNLGTQAVYEVLYGKEGNQHFPLFLPIQLIVIRFMHC